MTNNDYMKATVGLLQEPSKFGGAVQAANRLMYWAMSGGFDLGFSKSQLLDLCKQAIRDGKNSAAQGQLSIQAVRLQAIIDGNQPCHSCGGTGGDNEDCCQFCGGSGKQRDFHVSPG